MQCAGTPLTRQPVDCVMRHRRNSPAVTRDEEHRICLSSGQMQVDDSVRLPLGFRGIAGRGREARSLNTLTMTPSGEASIACRLSAPLAGPVGRPTRTNTFMKSANAFGICGAAIIRHLVRFDLEHPQVVIPGE
jgi:hypothetical protein